MHLGNGAGENAPSHSHPTAWDLRLAGLERVSLLCALGRPRGQRQPTMRRGCLAPRAESGSFQPQDLIFSAILDDVVHDFFFFFPCFPVGSVSVYLQRPPEQCWL